MNPRDREVILPPMLRPLTWVPVWLALASAAGAAPPDEIEVLLRAEAARVAAEPAAIEAIEAPTAASRAWLRWARLEALRARGRADEAAAEARSLGFVTRWEAVGPFAIEGGLEAVAPVEAEWLAGRADGAEYDGKRHAVSWHPVGDAGRFGRLDLAAVSHDALPGRHYARAAFELAEGGALAVRVGASVPYQIWIDGRLVGRGDVRRQARPDQDAFPVALAAGPHRVLVELIAEDTRPELLVRFSRPDGAPVTVTGTAHAPGAHPPAGPLPATPAALADPLAVAEAAARARPGDLTVLRRHARLRAVLQPGAPDTVRAWEAVVAAGGTADDRLALAATLDDDRERQRGLREAALVAAPQSPAAIAALARHESRRGMHEAAEALWARLPADAPADLRAEAGLALLGPLRRLDLHDPVRARLGELHHAHPDHPEVARAYADALIAVDRLVDAAAALTPLAEAGDEEAARRLADIDRRRHGPDAVLAGFAARRARGPFSVEARVAEAEALFALDAGDGVRRRAALELLAATTAAAPERPEVWAAAGTLRRRAGDVAAATQALRRSLALAPQQPDLRRYLGHLDPEARDIADRYLRDARDVIARADPATTPGTGARFLLDQTVVQVQPNGQTSRLQQVVVRLDDQTAVEDLTHHFIAFAPDRTGLQVLAAEILRPDGDSVGASRQFAERPFGKVGGVYSDYQTHVIGFDGLRPGDVVHVAWRLDELGDGALYGDAFGGVEYAQADYPKAEWTLVVEAPAGRPVHHAERGLGPPQVEVEGSRRVHRWTARGLSALPREPNGPDEIEHGTLVSFSSFADWDAVGRWYAELLRPQGALEAEHVALARQVAGDARDPEAIVARLFDYVVASTRYVGIEFGRHGFVPYPATQVLRRGYGDCKDKANLLVALLRALDVEAEVVLVRTADQGLAPDAPASPWVFNHAIAYVPALDRYLDATTELGGPEELPALDQGASALRITGRGGVRVQLPVDPAERNVSDDVASLRLLPDGGAVLDFRRVVRGYEAGRVRSLAQNAAAGRRALEQALAERWPGAEVLSFQPGSASRLQPAELAFTARLGDGAGTRPIPFPVDVVRRWAPTTERELPLALDPPREGRLSLDIEVPPGWRLVPPDNAQLETPFGRYLATWKRTPAGWRLERVWRRTARRVEPSDYAAFRAFGQAVEAYERLPLTLEREAVQ